MKTYYNQGRLNLRKAATISIYQGKDLIYWDYIFETNDYGNNSPFPVSR